MIGRRPPTPPDVQLARVTAAVDQVLAHIDTALRTHGGNRQLTDVLLDLRNLLRPRGDT